MPDSIIPGVSKEAALQTIELSELKAEDVTGNAELIAFLKPHAKRLEQQKVTPEEVKAELGMLLSNPGVAMALGLSSITDDTAITAAVSSARELAKALPGRVATAFFAQLEISCQEFMQKDIFDPKHRAAVAQVVQIKTQRAIRERNALPASEAIRTPLPPAKEETQESQT